MERILKITAAVSAIYMFINVNDPVAASSDMYHVANAALALSLIGWFVIKGTNFFSGPKK